MRKIVKSGVYLLVSGVLFLASCSGCGKKKLVIKWDDKQLEKILEVDKYDDDDENEEHEEPWWCNA